MYIDPTIYEDDFYDSDEPTFQKVTRKAKNTKHKQNDSIRKQRQTKNKEREKLLYELEDD